MVKCSAGRPWQSLAALDPDTKNQKEHHTKMSWAVAVAVLVLEIGLPLACLEELSMILEAKLRTRLICGQPVILQNGSQ